MKNRYYYEFSDKELHEGKCYMIEEIEQASKKYQEQLIGVFYYYWRKFMKGEFAVDGATFIDEEDGCFFNIWWFIHDGRNSEGYVSKSVDSEMLDIMILTNTPNKHFKQAIPYLKFTWLNVIRHIIKCTYKRKKPSNLIVIK